MLLLGIETSCDETAAAVTEDGRRVLSDVVASQAELHNAYGGVVPEIASRRHIECIGAVVKEALGRAGVCCADLDGIAVTYAPGLIGALLVGVNYAKGLSLALSAPLIPVHHIRGHIAANYIAFPSLKPPFVCLVVSGGHSHIVLVKGYCEFEVLGKTRDDAAGEAFDKVGRVLGLPYPGGVHIDRLSRRGDPQAIAFPRVHFDDAPFDFSFSGVKTAVINYLHTLSQRGKTPDTADVAASFSQAVCDVLVEKLIAAALSRGVKKAALAGGVAANSMLRERLTDACAQNGIDLFVPPVSLCGDNAAMIACQGYYEAQKGHFADLSLNGYAVKNLEENPPSC